MRKGAIAIVSDKSCEKCRAPGRPASAQRSLYHVLGGAIFLPREQAYPTGNWGTGPVARIMAQPLSVMDHGQRSAGTPAGSHSGGARPMPQAGIRVGAQLGVLILGAFVLAGCSATHSIIDPRYGVTASPRV